MQYSIEINSPIEKVYQLFTDRNNILKWQKSVQEQNLVSGEVGELQSVSELICKSVTIYETIVAKNSPNLIISEYEHKRNNDTKMFHVATNKFSSLGENKTLYETTIEQKVIGFFPKIIMKIFAGAVKKHHKKLLSDFKFFAESN